MNNDYDVIIICFTDPVYDARVINLIKTLAKYERNVALVTPDYKSNPNFIDKSNYYPIRINLNGRVRNSQKEFTGKIKKLKFTCMYVHAADYYSLPASKSIKVRTGAKLIYDSREIYSQLNSLRERYFAKKILEFREKYLVTYVDKIIVTAKEDELYLKKHFSHIIPYSIVKNLPKDKQLIETDKLRQKYNIPTNSLLILYQGWVLEGRGLDLLINVMKNVDDVYLVIIGDGEYSDKLKKIVTKDNLGDKVLFTGLLPYDELFEYTASADVGVVFFENTSISYQNALPNKLFEFIQAGLPVITSNQKTITDVVSTDNLGIIIKDLEPRNIIEAIEEMKSEELRNKYKENVIRIREKYSYESQELEILKVFS